MNHLNEIRALIERVKQIRHTNPQNENVAVPTTLDFSPTDRVFIAQAVGCESIFYDVATCTLRFTFSEPYEAPQPVVELPDYQAFTTMELILLRAALREFPEYKAHLDKVIEILRARGIG